MTPLFSPSGLARASARRPKTVLAIWFIVLLLAGISTPALKHGLTAEVKLLNAPESQRANDLLAAKMGGSHPATETIIVQSSGATVDDPAFRAVVERISGSLRAMPSIVRSVTDYYATNAPAMVSEDRRATVIAVNLAGNLDDAVKHAPDLQKAVAKAAGDAPFTVSMVGDGSINHEINAIAQHDLEKGEGIGLPIALVILVLVFGALVAAGLPMLLAVVGVFTAIGVTAFVSRFFELSFIVTNFITLIGLAVGIDYALFVIERYREERRRGLEQHDAIAAAGRTASRAVIFSGMTVVLALLGLFIVPINIFRSLSFGAVVVVIAAVAANLTLVPALLGLLGDRIDWPFRRDRRTASAARTGDQSTAGFWARTSRVVMGHPAIAVAASVALLLAAALPYRDLQRGLEGVSSLPAGSQARAGYERLASEFPVGLIAPVKIVIDGPASDPGVKSGVASLTAELGHDGAFGPATVATDNAGDLTLVTVPLTVSPDGPAATAAITRLRERLAPSAFSGVRADVLVTGETAYNVDDFATVDAYTPWVFAFVLGLSFLLLLIAFRSIVVPLKAIVMNLLSVGAAYGLLVLVFQKGYGDSWFGFEKTPGIESWLPLFLFAILFGLSMDYHVFLLSRIREHYDRTRNNRESVAVGLQATGKIITSAALIMVAVFSGFATGRLSQLQQAGFGLAVAILLDATLVRAILVPAAMALLGDRNWYLPSWLGWLPNVHVEGPAAEAPTAPEATAAD